MKTRKLWWAFAGVIIFSFGILGYYGFDLYLKAPPIPEKVVTADGTVFFTGQDIKDGQNVWQSMGGQEVGSVWGHGAYLAPDWSADWLHREAIYILNSWSKEIYNMDYESLSGENKAVLQARLKVELRTNTYNPDTKELKVSKVRADAIKEISKYYASLFMNDPALEKTRNDYSIHENTINDKDRMEKMNNFF